jgi:GT2 family glycosyltransferase
VTRTTSAGFLIVAYDSARHLPALLASLAADPPEGYARRIYLIDNASTDGGCDGIDPAAATVIRNRENVGFGAAVNLGAARAIGEGAEFLVLLNPDVTVTPGWFPPLLRAMDGDPRLACVQPRIMRADAPDRINSLGNGVHFLGFGYTDGHDARWNGDGPPLRPATYASGCACVFRAADFARAGGFDPGFFLYHEDQDLGWRLRLAGREVAVETRSVVHHHYEFDRDPEKFYHLERNRWAFLLSHFERRTLALVLPALLVMEIGTWVYCIRNGLADRKARAARDLLRQRTRRWIAARRARSMNARSVRDRDLAGLLADRLPFSPLQSALFARVVDPLLSLYWRAVRRFA